MGIAASLFYNANDTEKQTLHRRITPSEDQFEEQQARWNALADQLIADLRDKSGCAVRTWLQGSYKFGTQIRPVRIGEEFDIDLGVYFEWAGDPDDGPHSPKNLKAMTQANLIEYGARSDDVVEVITPPKSRCSRIRFQGGFHIDVPSYHLDPTPDNRALATEDDTWENSDPKKFYLWFRDLLDEARRAKARRAIQYMKCWTSLRFPQDARPSSILLTVLVAEAMNTLDDDEIAFDDDALHAILCAIAARLLRSTIVLNPVHDDEDLAARLNAQHQDEFVTKLVEFRDISTEALGAESELAAADAWSRAFDHFFPPPEPAVDFADAFMALTPVAPEVRVAAVSRDNPNLTFAGVNSIGPIPKNCDITFEIANPWMLLPTDSIQWVVRNAGDEAAYINDLGHHAGFGRRATERSSYRGTHYMDCLVRRNGHLVGVRRIPVHISGMFAPKRNPFKRATYRLLGRR